MIKKTLIILSLLLIISACRRPKENPVSAESNTAISWKTVVSTSESGLILREGPGTQTAKIALIPNLTNIQIILPSSYNPYQGGPLDSIWAEAKFGKYEGFVNAAYIATPYRNIPNASNKLRFIQLIDFALEAPIFDSQSSIRILDSASKQIWRMELKNLSNLKWISSDELLYTTEFGDAGYGRLEKHIINISTKEKRAVFTITLSDDPSGLCKDNDDCSCSVDSIELTDGNVLIMGRTKKRLFSLKQPYTIRRSKSSEGADCMSLTGEGPRLLGGLESVTEWEYDIAKESEQPLNIVSGKNRYSISAVNGLKSLP